MITIWFGLFQEFCVLFFFSLSLTFILFSFDCNANHGKCKSSIVWPNGFPTSNGTKILCGPLSFVLLFSLFFFLWIFYFYFLLKSNVAQRMSKISSTSYRTFMVYVWFSSFQYSFGTCGVHICYAVVLAKWQSTQPDRTLTVACNVYTIESGMFTFLRWMRFVCFFPCIQHKESCETDRIEDI